MVPRRPARSPQPGFLYVPPFRVQGFSVAGEASAVQVPELDVCFDIGSCPRSVLTSPYIALTHGHMDHAAAAAYYFSQRAFQGLGTGTLVCHPDLAEPFHRLMRAWKDIEAQRTPYQLEALAPEQELEIKPRTFLRALSTPHTPTSQGYVILERRQKLLPELAEASQAEIVERKKRGEAITYEREVPLVCYTGDTAWGEHFARPDVLEAQILITECTFVDQGDRGRAGAGRHLHMDEIVRLLRWSRAEAVVLTHVSRRTGIGQLRKRLERVVPAEEQHRLFVLMDNKTNQQRFERQKAELGGEDEDDQAGAETPGAE